jgi:transcriptional regulator with XRE-family HTH domain
MKHTMLAKRLKQLRAERGITVSELARRAEVVDNTVRQLELGNSEAPSFKVGLALSRALGIHPEELLVDPAALPQDSKRTKETLVDRMDKLETVVLKMLQSQGLHQQELEAIRAVIPRPSEAPRRASKPLPQEARATRRA